MYFQNKIKNSLPILVLVWEFLSNPLEMWSKETWRSSYARLVVPQTARTTVRSPLQEERRTIA